MHNQIHQHHDHAHPRHKGGHHRNHSHHFSEHEAYEDDTPLYEYYGELEPKEGLNLLLSVLKTLKRNGEVKLSDHTVAITDEVGFSIKHEETWDDTEKLSLEIEWYPNDVETNSSEEEEQDDALPEVT